MTVKPFPVPHRKVVATIARLMSEQPTAEKAEQLLIEHLDVQWHYNERRGVDPDDNERDILTFADAVQDLLSVDQVAILQRAVASMSNSRRAAPAPQQPPPRRSEAVLHVEIAPTRAKVLLFTPVRTQRYVRHLARVIVGAKSAEIGEVWLGHDIDMATRNLLAAGIDPVVVKREVAAFEASVRAEIWRIVITPEPEDKPDDV